MNTKRWLTATIFYVFVSFIVSNNLFVPHAISGLTAIPQEIVTDGLRHNALGVFLFGTYEERHDFAKGRTTAFGKMPYDTEKVMKQKYSMSDEKVHRIGSLYDFSSF